MMVVCQFLWMCWVLVLVFVGVMVGFWKLIMEIIVWVYCCEMFYVDLKCGCFVVVNVVGCWFLVGQCVEIECI